MDSWTKWRICHSPDHELGFSCSGHSDSCRQHVRVAWTKYAMRPDGNSSQSIRVSCQDSLQVTSQHKLLSVKVHCILRSNCEIFIQLTSLQTFLLKKYTHNWCSSYWKILQSIFIKCLGVWCNEPLLRRGGSIMWSTLRVHPQSAPQGVQKLAVRWPREREHRGKKTHWGSQLYCYCAESYTNIGSIRKWILTIQLLNINKSLLTGTFNTFNNRVCSVFCGSL